MGLTGKRKIMKEWAVEAAPMTMGSVFITLS